MAYTNDMVDLAHALFNTSRNSSTRRSSTAADVYFGQATSDSVAGMVWVVMDADVLSSGAAVELPCTVVVKQNDRVIITVYGHGMVVTGVIGGGDSMNDGIKDEFDEIFDAMSGVNDRIDIFGNKLDKFGNRLEEWTEEQEKFQSFWDNDLEELKHSIVDVDVQFAPGTSGTIAPTTGWRSGMFTPEQGQYVWTRNIYINGLGETVLGEPVCISDGRTLAKAPEEMYYLSTSATTLSGGSWSKTYPAFIAGRYYWTKTVITYLDGTTSESTPVCASDLSKAITGTQYFWHGSGGAYVSTTPKPANDGAPSSGNYLNLTASGMTLYSGNKALAAYTASKVTLLSGASTFETTRVTLANSEVIMDNTGIEFLKGDAKLCRFSDSDRSSYGVSDGIGIRGNNGQNITLARRNGNYNRTFLTMNDQGLYMYSTASGAAQLNLLSSGVYEFIDSSASRAKWDSTSMVSAFKGGQLLHNGNSSGTITLSRSTMYFDALLIVFYSSEINTYDSLWVWNPDGKTVSLSAVGGDQGRVLINTRKYAISGNKMTPTPAYSGTASAPKTSPEQWANINSGGSSFGLQASNTYKIFISRVVGFKFAA